MIKQAAEWWRHHKGTCIALIVMGLLATWAYGCKTTIPSPINPQVSVTRTELELEAEQTIARFEQAFKDLEKKELFKQKLFEIGIAFAQTGTIDPIGAGVTLLGILGVGAMVDNSKKNSLIKVLQKNVPATTSTTTTS